MAAVTLPADRDRARVQPTTALRAPATRLAKRDAAPAGPTLFVSPEGSDDASGDRSAPKATISGAVAALKPRGGSVVLAAGRYPAKMVDNSGSGVVLVRGPGSTVPPWKRNAPTARVVGRSLVKGDGITFDRVAFDGSVELRGTTDTTIVNSEFTGPETGCLALRGVHRVTISNVWVHHCVTGIGISGRVTNRSSQVGIRGSRIERARNNAVSFAFVDGLVLDGNLIRLATGGGTGYHNDLIQGMGSSDHVRISNNRMTDSDRQFMIFQANTGPNSDFVIANNVALRCGAIGVQLSGVRGVRFVNNTIWGSKFGALLLRGQKTTGPKALTAAVVANNVLSGLAVIGRPEVTLRRNLLKFRPIGPDASKVLKPANQTIVRANGLFVDVGAGNVMLRRGSPAKGRGAESLATRRDITGAGRGKTPSIGAYE